jgi:hypothetical protein
VNLTKRNHYNPCFWTALWNEAYYAAVVSGASDRPSPRSQRVHALNVRSGKVYLTAVENLHFDKNLGLAGMSPDGMKRFCRRWYPGEYDRVAAEIDRNPNPLVMDFENILTGTEKHGYEHFVRAAKCGGFASTEHKTFVACSAIIHAMRSHEFMATMVAQTEANGSEKWEFFWSLKNLWADRLALTRASLPLACARWTLYRTDHHSFPLCDSPVLINPNSVMMVLTPRLLAEIDLTVQAPENHWAVRDGISTSKYREFRRRSIQNTYKDILFSQETELQDWQRQREFRSRMREFRTPEASAVACERGAQRVMWALSGFGRVPEDFERWIEPIIEKARETKIAHDRTN